MTTARFREDDEGDDHDPSNEEVEAFLPRFQALGLIEPYSNRSGLLSVRLTPDV